VGERIKTKDLFISDKNAIFANEEFFDGYATRRRIKQ